MSGYDNEVDRAVKLSFATAIRYSYRANGSTLDIALNEPVEGEHADYLPTGDKVNKLFAVEPVRLFYKLPQFDRIKLGLATDGGVYMLDVTRQDVEEYYGVDFVAMREFDDTGALFVGKRWREQFGDVHHTKPGRAAFVERFVRFEE